MITRKNGGALTELNGQKVLLLKGTPYEMGYQHGSLLKNDVGIMVDRVIERCRELAPGTLEEIWQKEKEYIPDRFMEEMKGLANGAGIPLEKVQQSNIFPELFHCSGVALFGDATENGELWHGRILDYTVDQHFQDYAVVILSQPENHNTFINASFAGMVGTVTGMNHKQIAVGEMGGGGQGKWSGVPMTFLLRIILEEADSLEQALNILENAPRTCEYYYVISDGKIPDARAMKCVPEEMMVMKPGESHPLLPVQPLKDVVMISGGERYTHLREGVHKHYGKINKDVLIEVMKRPVSMESNLHNAIFSPQTLKMWFAVAKNPNEENFQACYQPYDEFDMKELMNIL